MEIQIEKNIQKEFQTLRNVSITPNTLTVYNFVNEQIPQGLLLGIILDDGTFYKTSSFMYAHDYIGFVLKKMKHDTKNALRVCEHIASSGKQFIVNAYQSNTQIKLTHNQILALNNIIKNHLSQNWEDLIENNQIFDFGFYYKDEDRENGIKNLQRIKETLDNNFNYSKCLSLLADNKFNNLI